jgi:hypothetical protein
VRKSFKLVPGKVPAQDISLTLRMQPIPKIPETQKNPTCVQDVKGLFWVGEDGETTTEITRVAPDLFGDYHPAQQFVFVARVLGELCDSAVTLTAKWEPAGGSDHPPKIWTYGPVMVIILVPESSRWYAPDNEPGNTYDFVNFGSRPGLLTVTGEVPGNGPVGPITLVVQCTGPYC